MQTKRVWAIVVPVALSLLLPGLVLGGDWGLPNLNPFASKTTSTSTKSTSNKSSSQKVSARVSDDDFSLAKKRSTATTEPSTWQKVSSGTSNTLKKTGSYLTPWKKQAPPPPPKPSGSRGIRTAKKAEAPASSTGSTWYNPTTWFGSSEPEPAPKRTESVSSFLGQSRPNY